MSNVKFGGVGGIKNRQTPNTEMPNYKLLDATFENNSGPNGPIVGSSSNKVEINCVKTEEGTTSAPFSMLLKSLTDKEAEPIKVEGKMAQTTDPWVMASSIGRAVERSGLEMDSTAISGRVETYCKILTIKGLYGSGLHADAKGLTIANAPLQKDVDSIVVQWPAGLCEPSRKETIKVDLKAGMLPSQVQEILAKKLQATKSMVTVNLGMLRPAA